MVHQSLHAHVRRHDRRAAKRHGLEQGGLGDLRYVDDHAQIVQPGYQVPARVRQASVKRGAVAQLRAGPGRIGELVVPEVGESDHAHAGSEELVEVLSPGAQAVSVQHGHERAAPSLGCMGRKIVRRQRQADALRIHFKRHAPDGGSLGARLLERPGISGIVQGAMRGEYGKGGGVKPAPLHLRQVHRFESVHAGVRLLRREREGDVHVGIEGEHAIMERANFRRHLAV